jgi:hypothetical protein
LAVSGVTACAGTAPAVSGGVAQEETAMQAARQMPKNTVIFRFWRLLSYKTWDLFIQGSSKMSDFGTVSLKINNFF